MKKIIEKVSQLLVNRDFSDEIMLIGKKEISIKAVDIQKINFSRNKEIKEINQDKTERMWFLDGGIVIGYYAQTLAIAKIRIAAVEYDVVKKIRNDSISEDFSVLAYVEGEEISFLTEPTQKILDSKKKIERNYVGKNNSILNSLNHLRRKSELNYVMNLSSEKKIIILDGPLIREEDEPETKTFFNLNDTQILGIIKSTDDYTNKGRNVCYALSRQIREKEPWFCVVNEDEIITGFTKLSKNSNLILKFQATKTTKYKEILCLLSELSNDPSFSGYPYGLIEADELARISNKEKEELSFSIINSTKFQKDLEEAEEMSKPHDKLDNIKF